MNELLPFDTDNDSMNSINKKDHRYFALPCYASIVYS